MTDMFRHCPHCGSAQRFAQYHAEPVPCPDAVDGICPEWSCEACGTVLLIGGTPAGRDAMLLAGPNSRVA